MDCFIKKGNIVYAKVDVIVNAANKYLLAGGGVCGAIFNTCGHYDELQRDCNKLGPIKTGEAVITKGYDLNAKYIIHAVGPVYKDDNESSKLLFNVYYNSLKLADEKGLTSIAFPSISTGIFGYPLDKAPLIALSAINMYKANNLKECYIYCYDDKTYEAYIKNYNIKTKLLKKYCFNYDERNEGIIK